VGNLVFPEQVVQQPDGLVLAAYQIKTNHRSGLRPGSIAELAVDPFAQFFAGFKKRESFGFDQNPGTGFRITAGVTLVFFDKKAAQPPYFNTFPDRHGFRHVIEEYLNDLGCFGFGHIGFSFQGRDQFQFIHTTSLAWVADDGVIFLL
jgi:hypothetical protein